ncbi:LysR family transcriptional regulator [Sphingomonas sp. 22R3R2A-7]|jgi:LysR family transcriptional regulator of gallate degradation|uniref:LysR family transcriptional regulator n=1 Tax=Sphingomonas sp. 22R3R2A-7 TaxID=3050230 RepID=UPI002FE00F35
MAIELRALEHFVNVAESSGFAAAARKMRTSQPNLSRSIAQLEASMGAKLFDRTTRGTAITEEGRRLLPHAISIINEIARAQSLFETPQEEEIEQVGIGVSPSLLYRGLPAALGALTQHPDKRNIVISTGTLEELLEQVRKHAVHAALCIVPDYMSGRRSDHADVTFQELADEEMIPVARSGHPVFAGERSMADLSAYDWVVPHQMSVSYRFESAFFRRNLTVPAQRLNCSSMHLLMTAILDWSLIGIVPRFLVERELAGGTLRVLDMPELHFPYALSMITLKSAIPTQGVAAVLQSLRTHMQRDPK